MAVQQQLSNLLQFKSPLNPSEVGRDPDEFPPIPEDMLQLATDMINVVEGRIDIKTFSEEYQKKIRSFYRFSATRYTTNKSKIAKRTPNTLEII